MNGSQRSVPISRQLSVGIGKTEEWEEGSGFTEMALSRISIG